MRLASVGVVTVVLLAASTVAMAQTPEAAVGRKAWVTMADATVHHGVIARVTPEVVTLVGDGGTTQLPRQDVRRIEARDSVSDGIKKGAIGLGVVGAAMTGYLGYATCESANCAGSTLKIGLMGAALGGATGALVGALLDAANPGRQVLFERAGVTVAPVLAGRSRSVAVVVRW